MFFFCYEYSVPYKLCDDTKLKLRNIQAMQHGREAPSLIGPFEKMPHEIIKLPVL